jgi:hypothetical protein
MPTHDFFNEEPRVTRAGRVSAGPYPYLALLAEADGRYAQLMGMSDRDSVQFKVLKAECHGIAVAISALHADTIEEVSQLVHDRFVARANGLPIPEYVVRRADQYV